MRGKKAAQVALELTPDENPQDGAGEGGARLTTSAVNRGGATLDGIGATTDFKITINMSSPNYKLSNSRGSFFLKKKKHYFRKPSRAINRN